MFLGNEKWDNNKCEKDDMSNEVNTLPCCPTRCKLKQHKSTAKVLHGAVMEKPAEPVVVVTEFW